MPKLVRWITVCITSMIIFLCAPFICGLYLQHHFNALLTLYSSAGNVQVQLLHYKRSWFTSDAVINLEIINPKFSDTLAAWGIADSDIPKKYIIEQHIQHGPIFYHATARLPTIFGIATIQNKLQLSPEVLNFFKQLGVSHNFIEIDDDLVTFSGNYFKHFKIGFLHKKYPGEITDFKMHSLEGYLWVSPNQPRISGNLELHRIELIDAGDVLKFPRITLQLDQQKSAAGFWLGNSALLISEIILQAENGDGLSVKDLNLKTIVKERTGMLDASGRLDIAKFKINEEEMGPIHLHIMTNNINGKELVNLIDAYQVIQERGELYQSQLKQKMLFMLPNLVNSGTSINLDILNIDTSLGKLQMNGELLWNMDTASVPDEVDELITAADGKMDLNISKALLDKCIELASTLAWFNQPTPELQHAYSTAHEDMYFALQHNDYIISILAQNNLLPEVAAISLQQLVEERASLQDYAIELKQLLLNRQISLAVGYWLYWQYTEIERPLTLMSELVQKNQNDVMQQLHAQLAQWIKAGYIEEQHKIYKVSIKQEQGKIKINGHDIATP